MKYQDAYNPFYEALSLLEKFEAGTLDGGGLQHAPHFALNRIIGLFSAAMAEGDCVAPYFLHYVANKYQGILDPTLLPNLNQVPHHKSQAQNYLQAYQEYIETLKLIDTFAKKPRVIVAQTVKQAEYKKKKLENEDSEIRRRISSIFDVNSPISNLLAAKLMQKYNTSIQKTFADEDILVFYERSAMYPNVWAMVEYWQILERTGTLDIDGNNRHQKLKRELDILESHQADIADIANYYIRQKDDRFASQWSFQSAIHGDTLAIIQLIEHYLQNTISWMQPLSDDEAFDEAILWCDWLYKSCAPNKLAAVWSFIVGESQNYLDDKGEKHLTKAIFLAQQIGMFHDYVKANLEFFHANPVLATMYQQSSSTLKELLFEIWQKKQHCLPAILEKSTVIMTELALKLESEQLYAEAEYFYRKAFDLEPESMISQYNVANILNLQEKNTEEKIALYFQAASQGCEDSLHKLFEILIFERTGTASDLFKLKQLAEDSNLFQGTNIRAIILETEMDLPKAWIIPFIDYELKTRFYDCQQQSLFNWKADAITFLKESYAQKKTFFGASKELLLVSTQDAKTDESAENIDIEVESLAEQPEGADEPLEQVPAATAVEEELLSVDVRKQRALNKLDELSTKKTTKLTLRDFIEAKKCYQEIHQLSGELRLSHKGRTSGSSVAVGRDNFHAQHHFDRWSPQAQQKVKRYIATAQAGSARLGF